MNRLYAALLFLTIACLGNEASAGQKLRVYFIGNSYIYTNNMPQMLADIATSMGDTLVFEEHTPGGSKLEDHWSNHPNDPCISKIKTGNWDYVVLQEQSQMPVFGVLNPSHPTYIYAGQFTKLIRDSAQCTSAMFYMTWGYKNGDATNCPGLPYMCTYLSMDSAVRMRYLELADSFDAVVSPAGAVRRFVRQEHPGIELYQPDGSHPSVAGTYAVACSFYTALFKKDPTQITFASTLPAADASNIRDAAKTVVYDSLSKWGLNIYDNSAAYDYSISGTAVNFTNKSSVKAVTYNWNFGDGSTSIQKNPVHTYATKAEYIVTLTTFDANGCSKTTSKKVNLLAAGIHDAKNVSFTINPNPAGEYISIQANQQGSPFHIRITNAMGQTVYLAPNNKTHNATRIDLSSFSSGMYYITLYNSKEVLYKDKFVKQ